MNSFKRFLVNCFPTTYYKLFVYNKTSKAKKIVDIKSFTIQKYEKRFGVKLDLDNPKTFYEKLNFLKINWSDPGSSYLVDKHLVKKYLTSNNYEELVAKEIACFDSFKEFKKSLKELISANSKFVIKLTHTSGDVFFYDSGRWKDKEGYKTNKRRVLACLKIKIKYNYYFENYEKIYKDLSGKILVEEYLPSNMSKGLDEMKFFCNYGKPVLINYVEGRQDGDNLQEAFLDANLENTKAKQKQKIFKFNKIDKPDCFEQMKDFCLKTCSSFPLVRVDLMLSDNSFRFCEFTFYDCGGYNIFTPNEINYSFGELVKLNK